MELFIFTFGALFSVMNPIGSVPIFLSLTQNDSRRSKNRTALWTSINVLIILIVSFFAGRYILNFFGISIDVLRITGGLIICMSAYGLLMGATGKQRGVSKKVTSDAQHRSDISLTPLAIPMMAGPGAMSLLIAMFQDYPNFWDKIIIVSAILTSCLVIFIVLSSSNYISRLLGASGIVAVSRIVGFLVMAIGIQYIVNSLVVIFKVV